MGMGFESKHDFAPPFFFLGLLFALGSGELFGGMQHSPVDGCSAASCNFGVLAGADAHTSFYSAILPFSYRIVTLIFFLLQLLA